MVFPVMTINCKALLIESAKCLGSACSSLSPLPHHLFPKSPMTQLKCQVLQDTLPDPTPSLSQYPSFVSSATSHLHFCKYHLPYGMKTLCVCVGGRALSPLTLCDPTDCSPPGSSVHGIPQARILGWLAISFTRGSSLPRDWTWVSYVSCISRQILYH